MDVMKEDSYARRREVFKNIWLSVRKPLENLTNCDKSKVIRTARLSSELQRYNFNKQKHQQRMKLLKINCDKILGNENETMFFEQLTASHPLQKIKRRKKKKHIGKKKMNKILEGLKIIRSTTSGTQQNFSKLPMQVMALKAEDNLEYPQDRAVDAPEGTTSKRRRRRVVKKKRGKLKKNI